jgi:hypothetical protein
MNLPSDLQRFLPYIAVAVLAFAGLLLVMRGVGPSGDEGGNTVPAQIDRGGEARSDGNRGEGSGSGRDGSNRDSGSTRGERAPVKRSAKGYVACVEQATDTAALEKCQALLP